MKSPLRYPGGKTRAVKHILPLIPEDCKVMCSPFLGGGSVELAAAEKGIKVYGYDIFEPLIWFWKGLLKDPQLLALECDKYRTGPHEYSHKGQTLKARGLLKEDFSKIREELRGEKDFSFQNAAKFYAINRSSFSGATFSGGWSKRASYARFTESSIDRLRNFKEPNLIVEQADFKTSIVKHPDAFLYLDPPYMLGKTKDKLYGDKGSTHSGFDHDGLYDLLKERENWIMSYNDCSYIRDLYRDYDIISASWSYGMNKSKQSSEILIIGK